jgi:hypothetical protein
MASAGIRMAPTGRYKVWWRLDDASQGSQTFDTRDQARDFKHDLLARLARELAVRHLTADDGEDDKKLLAEQVAGSVAKYATKATEALGVTLDHRIGEAELKDLDLPAHVAELVRAWWELGARPGLGELPLRKWTHMLGFGGHSRPRAAATPPPWGRCGGPGHLRHPPPPPRPDPPVGRPGVPEDDQAVIVVASWSYLGSGYQTTGEAWLAASTAARAREARRIAREELRTRTIAA